MTLDPISIAALGAAFLLLMLLAAQRRLRNGLGVRRAGRREAVDTVIGWRPEAARVMTAQEIAAKQTLEEAMPGHMVLSQVPLSRFVRVPMRNSYAEWLGRVGNLNADLLLCDGEARVLAVVEVRMRQESDRSKRRHERMARVLRAAGIPILVWLQDSLPDAANVRTQLAALLGVPRASSRARSVATPSSPAPLTIPAVEVTELLAEGDARAAAADLPEPVASGFFDDLEMDSAGGTR